MLKKATKYLVLLPPIALVLGLGSFAISANPVVQVQQIPVAQAHNPTTVDVKVDCDGWTADVGYANFSDGHYMEVTITGAGDQPIVKKSDALNGNGTLHYSGTLSGDGPFDIVVSAQAKYPNGKNEGSPVVGEGKHKAGCNPPTPEPTATPTPEPKKVYVCKYVGTPGEDERLQTGQNPIEVSVNAIPEDPVVVGSYFADAQGRSYVLGFVPMDPEPTAADCPQPVNPTPTPEPTATPTPAPTSTPTHQPSHKPTPKPTLPPTDVAPATSNTSGSGSFMASGIAVAIAIGALLLPRRQRKTSRR